jgi:radical SAM superfamily enzyme YgiQ (UPF0313 family)
MSQTHLEPGWVALIGPEIEENLGMRSLAASLEAAGVPAELLPLNNEHHVVPVMRAILDASEPPPVVAFSLSFQWRAKDFLSLAVGLRENGFAGHITAGGHFGTFEASSILADFPELDSICRHEAEETLVELVRALSREAPLRHIAGLALRDEAGEVVLTKLRSPPDLTTLPWPDRRGEPTRCVGHRIAPMIASRGCYARCAFCCIAAWHEATLPGKRFRLRPIDDVADEMAWLRRHKAIDIFIFHDDNFFVPGHGKSLDRINALADALEARGLEKFGTVVKARPNDVTPEVFGAMKKRLGCIRVFLGVETDATQGLVTLARRVERHQNHNAMDILRELDLYVCFNMLIFDPDTTFDSLETNLAFLESHGYSPCNFGRVELYAGTPLLERMRREGRCRGDYLGWNYDMASPEVQRVFELTMRCFRDRNFAYGAMANRLMGTRFDVEVCRFFEPEVYRPEWLDQATSLSDRLTRDSVAGLREIIDFVQNQGVRAEADELVKNLSARLRHTETTLRHEASALEHAVQAAADKTCMHSRPQPWGRPVSWLEQTRGEIE